MNKKQLRHARSRFKLHAVWGRLLRNTKNGTTSHTNYSKAGFTQSEIEQKMVLSHIKYGKAGCDRDITPRLGVCDRDITDLSAHALIGHCLGNSHVTCQKHFSWKWERGHRASVFSANKKLMCPTVIDDFVKDGDGHRSCSFAGLST